MKKYFILIAAFGFLCTKSSAQEVFYPADLVWCTHYGEQGELVPSAAEIRSGIIYMAGSTNAPVGVSSAGVHQEILLSNTEFDRDGFLAAFNLDGVFLWGTYFGGVGSDWIQDMELDAQGNLIVVGRTVSNSGIASEGAYMSQLSGFEDGFIASFSNTGQLNWSTYFGGSQYDHINTLALDEDGRIWFAGTTSSPDLPVTNAFQSNYGGGETEAFVARFSAGGELEFCSYFGGIYEDGFADLVLNEGKALCLGSSQSPLEMSPNAMQSQSQGSTDAIIIEIGENDELLYSSFYGGLLHDSGMRIATTEGGYYALFRTLSDDLASGNGPFEERFGLFDLLLTRFNADHSIDWTTYFGGESFDDLSPSDILVYDAGVMIAGGTGSPDMPTLNAYESVYDTIDYNGIGDCFIAGFAHDGEYQFGTFFGSYSRDYATKILLNDGSLYLLGSSKSGGLSTSGAHFEIQFGYLMSGLIARFTLATSIPEIEDGASRMKAYPNPISKANELTISAEIGINSWTISHLNGKLIREELRQVPSSKVRIDLEEMSLSSGVYLIEVVFADGSRAVERVVME